MAAPPNITLKDLSGTWIMNKTLSDDPDPILIMQGIGWFLRKAIEFATVTLEIKQYKDDDGLTHIDLNQTASGVTGTTENRTLDWKVREHKDGVFGAVNGQSRWVKLEDVDDDEFLKTGWDDAGEHVQSYVESQNGGWTANQIWGFEQVEGERYHSRHVIVRKGDDFKQARFVYNYQLK